MVQIIAFDAFARVSCKREVSGICSEFAPSLGHAAVMSGPEFSEQLNEQLIISGSKFAWSDSSLYISSRKISSTSSISSPNKLKLFA